MARRYPFASMLFLATTTARAADNPMWRDGLSWSCRFSSTIRCERIADCASSPEEGTFRLDYSENQVIDQKGTVTQIKRHYTQSVAGSPIGSEVKVELETNEAIWLSLADGAGVFSDNWIGAMLSPKSRRDRAGTSAVDLSSLCQLPGLGQGIKQNSACPQRSSDRAQDVCPTSTTLGLLSVSGAGVRATVR